ncbi:MAG: zinc metalloprotease HtpX [Thermodesulfobacteriota bacterium]|nr:zinc metalloprotease HtpX [Thermodesulfobacteriota bacterium]
MANQLKTTILLASLTGLILIIGQYFGGSNGLVIAFFFAVIMNFGSYWFSDKIVLSIYKAQEISSEEYPRIYNIVTKLTQNAGMPMPRIYIIPTGSPNAFATGRNAQHAAVAVTQGILQILNDEELEGVLAHELAHIKNRDILIGSIAATLAGVIMMLASFARWAAIFGGFSRDSDDDGGGIFGLVFMAILAPIAATIIQMAISRSREYLADAKGAYFAQNPSGLANALEKLHYASGKMPLESNPATSHMFIVNPLSGRSLINLFSTHPAIEERVKRLRNIKIF